MLIIANWAFWAALNALMLISLVWLIDNWFFKKSPPLSYGERYFVARFTFVISLFGPLGTICIVVWLVCCVFLIAFVSLLEALARNPGVAWLERKLFRP